MPPEGVRIRNSEDTVEMISYFFSELGRGIVGIGRACLGMERKKRTALPDVGGRRESESDFVLNLEEIG